MTELFIILTVSIILTYPLFKSPNDDHFADYTSWALFRGKKKPLPHYFLQLNQGGFTRMFLYYLAALVLIIVGRKKLLLGIRSITTILNTFIALTIYFVATTLLSSDNQMSLIASLIYLYISTRPQFELLKYNPELYHVAGSMVTVAFILSFWPNESRSVWWVLPAFTWLVFVGLNCKILFCLDSVAMAIALFILTGFNIQILFIYFLAVVISSIIFKAIFQKISLKNLLSLRNYLKYFNNESIVQNFKYNYKIFYYKTPLLGYLLLYFICLVISSYHSKFLFLFFWSISTIVIVIQQKRFCTYFFQICFAPLCIVICVGLSRLYSIYPPLVYFILAGFVVLSWLSVKDSFKYYFDRPAIDHIKTAYGTFYILTSYDFRVEDVVEHYNSHGESFIVWQTDLSAHYITDQAPICLISTMVYHAHVMYPKRQQILINSALKKNPKWVYDFSGSFWGNYQFNAINFYLSCGIGFVPEKKKNNVLYYRFENQNEPPLGEIVDHLQLYVLETVILDTFSDEVQNICGLKNVISEELKKDLPELCMDLIDGTLITTELIQEKYFIENLMERPNITLLYLCVAALAINDIKTAKRYLCEWKKSSIFFIQLYPLLSFSVLSLQIMCGISESELQWPGKDVFEISFPKDSLAVLKLLEKIVSSELYSESHKQHFISYLSYLEIEDTDYKYNYSPHLSEIKEKLCRESFVA